MLNYTLLEFDSLESTNDFLKENHSYFPHLTIIRTNYQTKGRGQYDRTWSSNPNDNLLFSILIKDSKVNPFQIKSWILEALMTFFQSFNLIPFYKEPNDIYINEKKICGILIETKATNKDFDYIIIGVGLNINQQSFDGLNATSLKIETSQTFHIKQLFQKLIDEMIKGYKKINI